MVGFRLAVNDKAGLCFKGNARDDDDKANQQSLRDLPVLAWRAALQRAHGADRARPVLREGHVPLRDEIQTLRPRLFGELPRVCEVVRTAVKV